MQVKKHQLEPNMVQRTGSKLGKEYITAVYSHPPYLTYMQSTSWESLGWMKHKLESGLLGEISIMSDMQMTPLFSRKRRRTKEPLDESERGEWKSSTFRKQRSWHLIPSLLGKQMGKQWKQWETLFFSAPKSLQMVTAAMKLKDTYSLEEKLWPT